MSYPLTTTLAKLREAKACKDGYKKLISALSCWSYDLTKRTCYRRNSHTPIPLTYILNTNGLSHALWALRASDVSERDCRLYTVACARMIQHFNPDPRVAEALNVAERYANGGATDIELEKANIDALHAVWDIADCTTWDDLKDPATSNSRYTTWYAAKVAKLASKKVTLGVTIDCITYVALSYVDDAANVYIDNANASYEDVVASKNIKAAKRELFIAMCEGNAPWQKGEEGTRS